MALKRETGLPVHAALLPKGQFLKLHSPGLYDFSITLPWANPEWLNTSHGQQELLNAQLGDFPFLITARCSMLSDFLASEGLKLFSFVESFHGLCLYSVLKKPVPLLRVLSLPLYQSFLLALGELFRVIT